MKLELLVLPLTVLMSTGCSSLVQDHLYADYSAEPLTPKAFKPYLDLTTELQRVAGDPGADGKPKPLVQPACFSSKVSDPTLAETCTAERNQAISAMAFASEELCVAHRRTIYGNDAAWNVGLGTMTNVFAGAASVAAVARTKSILAALALFSNSERSLVNETVYKTMLVTAVDKKIVESRNTQMTNIALAMKKDINTYTMADALRDVTTFHANCSFMTGLQRALEEGTQSGSAQRLLRVKTNLSSLVLERNAAAALAPAAGASSPQLASLDDRIKVLSDLMSKLESE